jgi:segregation and condensation protein B
MPPSPDPPFDSQPQGISLDELAAAFAQVMGAEPRQSAAENDRTPEAETPESTEAVAEVLPPEPAPIEDPCPINPRSIFEAMLFVGNRENRPLTPARAAELMRDVEVDEIPSLVDELNRRYAEVGAVYRIVGEEDGYQLALCDEFFPLRDRFYGRVREARLSQAAVDVLALVAYQQPITGERIGQLRGKPSTHVLAHLVRRGLLRIERPDPKRRAPHYYTTDRFLRLFNLQSLEDLPRSEDGT